MKTTEPNGYSETFCVKCSYLDGTDSKDVTFNGPKGKGDGWKIT